MKNFKDTIGNRTRYLPAFGAVLQIHSLEDQNFRQSEIAYVLYSQLSSNPGGLFLQ
jgi:hypothetical protein